ncbi:hypothetical protein BDV41DRAFT_540659 [Aspergillus transmontanensis]|uniref:Uncharacterized protein n=1 Tax=Aspergillus transmontanensis TaxID=1034304 RepID=A0A5N6VUA6_9EURO|nr:hypothetical protein BDV41DRAFT_540659 [Aspergillus transmontanensis]
MGELFAVSFPTIKHGWSSRRLHRENCNRHLERREIRIVALPALWSHVAEGRPHSETHTDSSVAIDWENWGFQDCHGRSPPSPLQVIAKDWSICIFDLLCRAYSPSTTVCGNPSSLSASMYLSGSIWLNEQSEANHHPIWTDSVLKCSLSLVHFGDTMD